MIICCFIARFLLLLVCSLLESILLGYLYSRCRRLVIFLSLVGSLIGVRTPLFLLHLCSLHGTNPTIWHDAGYNYQPRIAFIFRTGPSSTTTVPPAITAIRALLLTEMSTAHVSLHPIPNLADVPPTLAGLATNTDPRMHLLSLTHSLRTATLNRESKFFDLAAKDAQRRQNTAADNDEDEYDEDKPRKSSTATASATEGPLHVSNWAGGNEFKRFLSDSDIEWLADVFMSVPGCKLSRNDLFHAHMVLIPSAQDVILAFHCKVNLSSSVVQVTIISSDI
jgi:hypothetical protein